MASSNADKRDAFMQRIKVNNTGQSKAAKQSQFSSNNKSSSNSSSNKASAPARGKALGGGRGNER